MPKASKPPLDLEHLDLTANWLARNRPKVEAFFHARFMLHMAVRYGSQLKELPDALPSGWAALLYLYGLR